MKRKTLTVLILLCAAQAFAQNGTIKELSGTVELKRAGQTDFITAKPGDAVAKDTVVSTGFKSTVLIDLGSTVLTVRPLTRLSLAEISASADSQTLNISLQTGRVRVEVNPPAGNKNYTSISSTMATASVRGTAFEFDTQSLTVLSGTVEFQGRQGGVMPVSAGFTSEIKENGMAADPIETALAALLPPPLAGSDSGFMRSIVRINPDNSGGEFNIELILQK